MESSTSPQSNLPFPAELRIKILTHLLVEEQIDWDSSIDISLIESNPPAFYTRKADHECIPHLITLTQTCKPLRSEALTLFFSQNRFRLQDFKTWEKQRSSVNAKKYAILDDAGGAISLIRDLEIYVSGTTKRPDSKEEVRGSVRVIVDLLNQGHCLKLLTVKWTNHFIIGNLSRRGYAHYKTQALRAKMRIHHASRRDDGMRKFNIYIDAWRDDEIVVLEPLKELRGVEKPLVIGCVTDQWALWLEKCMKLGGGVRVDEFVRRDDFPDQTGKSQPFIGAYNDPEAYMELRIQQFRYRNHHYYDSSSFEGSLYPTLSSDNH